MNIFDNPKTAIGALAAALIGGILYGMYERWKGRKK